LKSKTTTIAANKKLNKWKLKKIKKLIIKEKMKKIKNNGKIKELNINVKKIIKTNKIAEVIFVIILLFFIIGFLM
jgi:hypothetical protein